MIIERLTKGAAIFLLMAPWGGHANAAPIAKSLTSTYGKTGGGISPSKPLATLQTKPESLLDDTAAATEAAAYETVYCDAYNSGNISGYSLYRLSDHKDLANAIWTGDASECQQAAQDANAWQSGLVCARYSNTANNTIAYSLYRISDNQDLGKATIGDFYTCRLAMASLRSGIFCSTYTLNGQTMWSMYDVQTGNDLGTKAYPTLDECQKNY